MAEENESGGGDDAGQRRIQRGETPQHPLEQVVAFVDRLVAGESGSYPGTMNEGMMTALTWWRNRLIGWMTMPAGNREGQPLPSFRRAIADVQRVHPTQWKGGPTPDEVIQWGQRVDDKTRDKLATKYPDLANKFGENPRETGAPFDPSTVDPQAENTSPFEGGNTDALGRLAHLFDPIYNIGDDPKDGSTDTANGLLRAFLPNGGNDFLNEQESEASDALKRQNLLMGQYKPPNWPLGNVDNKFWVENLVNEGRRFQDPLFPMPVRLNGGTLDPANLYGTYNKVPSDINRYYRYRGSGRVTHNPCVS